MIAFQVALRSDRFWSNRIGLLCTTALILALGSCIPAEKQPVKAIRIGLDDAKTRQILDIQDRRVLDSLYLFLTDTDPTYRYYATLALSSVGDSTSIIHLAKLLTDPAEDIRLMAAYALGQIRSPGAVLPLIGAFDPWDTLGLSAPLNAAILEAVGKSGDTIYLDHLSAIKSYTLADSLYVMGQTLGILEFALSGHTLPAGTMRMASILGTDQAPKEARKRAAYYFVRAKGVTFDTLIQEMVTSLRSEQDPDLRMLLAQAVGKSKNELALNSLAGLLPLEKDYRVRCNMVKALGNFDYIVVKDALIKAFRDSSYQVGLVAAEVLSRIGDPKESQEWLQLARSTKHPWVKAHLYRAVSRICPVFLPVTRTGIQNDLKFALNTIQDPYLRGVYIQAMGQFGWNVPFLREEWARSRPGYTKTTAIEALKEISDRPDFNTIFGASARSIRKNLGEFFNVALQSRDAGSVATAAAALRNPTSGYRDIVRTDTSFQKALANCKLPGDIEVYNELVVSQSFFKRNKIVPVQVAYNHPIDWENVLLVKANTRAVIKTAKGNIILILDPNKAPGSVGNFIQLAKAGFYDGKVFHRVVPNFVVQAGCPRGDGYGSLDYTIRSEVGFSRFDRAGLLGMASAGLHTEGTQFFITHSPAYHLNGKYTCFGEVESGMDIVHSLVPGDIIENIEIIY